MRALVQRVTKGSVTIDGKVHGAIDQGFIPGVGPCGYYGYWSSRFGPVYGGYRGRTLSSPRQAEVWPALVAGGIRQVIDLRADYTADVYSRICSHYGVEYYHYPVAEDEKSIQSMVLGFNK